MAISNPEIFPSATLPASPTFDASGEQKVEGQRHLALFCSYTQGAANGAVTILIEYSPNGSDWFQSSLLFLDAVTQGSDSDSPIQRNKITYTSTAAGAETFIIWLTDPDHPQKVNAQDIRIQVSETGVPGTPGTFSAILRRSDDQ